MTAIPAAVQPGFCPVKWCYTCTPSDDPEDTPHRHDDRAIEFEVSSPRQPRRLREVMHPSSPLRPPPLIIQRSCLAYGDGTCLTTVDIVRDDLQGIGVGPEDALELAEVLRRPELHFGRPVFIELHEAPIQPLLVWTESDEALDPRDYTLHLAQFDGGRNYLDYFIFTPAEAQQLGQILSKFSYDGP
ncbi:hypothetical protein [Nocardia suismassiliense]|uniref:hypothetical protein n=1 Tax=Nocardia suismassiliense TaxID=2077092 RepID=UPI00131EDDF9|nr:hypothetical protein [Nocardia suismassiliense]